MDEWTSPNLPKMPDEQATGLTEALTEAVRAASFGPFRFVRAKERYNYTQIRQLHAYALEGRVDLRPRELYSIEVHADVATLANLVNALEALLSPYIDAGSGKLGFHQTELTLDDFAKATIRAAAIASPEEAVAALQRWAGGAPWVNTWTFTVTGITLESPLHIGTGVSLRRLPEQPHEMRRFVPGVLVDELQRPGFLHLGAELRGATVLCSEEYQRPVFWLGNERPAGVEEIAFPGGWDGLFSLLRGLSVVCNTCVESQFQWSHSVPLQRAFAADSGEGWGGSGRPGGQRVAPAVPLAEPFLKQALSVSSNFRTAPKPVSDLIDRVYARWENSLRGHSARDQLIEMRIALETLFAGTGQHEARLRVAYHGAKYLGQSPEARRRLFDELKTIYSTASTLIHGGTPQRSLDLQHLARRAQHICRDAILKLVSNAGVPDWTDLMLNGPRRSV